MSKLSSIFLRALPGAYIINSGVGKVGMPAEASEGLQQYAATGMPLVKAIPADKFALALLCGPGQHPVRRRAPHR